MTGIYFSGTGNTKFCLSQFLNKVGSGISIYPIEDKNAVSAVSESKEIIFAYPIYYSNLPKIVRDFIEDNRTLWPGKNIFIIATMGLFSGDGSGVSARLFRKYGANIIGGLHLRMPDCIGDVKALKKPFDENRKLVEAACEKISNAAELYMKGNPVQEGLNIFYHLAGLFGQRLYFSGKTKNYTDNPKIDIEKCIGCGACEKLCPMKNIHIENGKAASGNMCTMCYRCFCNCPQQAITLIGKKVLEQHRIEKFI